MSHARQALASLRASTDLLARNVKLPVVPASVQMVKELAAGDAAPAGPGEDVLGVVRRNLLHAARASAGVGSAAPRDLRDAPWLMWNERDPLGGMKGLLEAVFRLCERRAGARRRLIEGWIQDFSYDAPRISEAGIAIRRLLAGGSDSRFDSWRDADGWCRLFDAREGPRTLACHVVQGTDPVDGILTRACLDDPMRAVSGYVRVTAMEALRLTAERLGGSSSAGAVERLSQFLAPGGKIRFADPEMRGQVARGLLAPWLVGRAVPSEPVRAAVQAFLLSHLGDPRLRASQWSRAGDDAVALMRRWLARASLKAFFEVIGEYAYDRHWRYREAFWSACLNAGGIDDAWLAFGGSVHASARAVKDLNGAYARLTGSGVQGEQSILLLRVRNVVFCEWSHNGKLRAWPVDWKTAPKLYQSLYTRNDVTGAGLPFPANPYYGSNGSGDSAGLSHVGSDSSRWQGSVAKMLADRANIHLSHKDWTPK